MPTQQLLQEPNPLRSISLDVEDLTSGAQPGTRITLRVQFADGPRATICSAVVPEGDVGNLPDYCRDLLDAFLFGEGPGAVIRWAQARDRSAMSKKVRNSL